MLQISQQNESQLINLAHATGKSINELLETLIESYQDDCDVRDAENALKETGGIELNELKAKYGL